MSDFIKTFDQAGTFAATRAAEQWLKENGYSVGPGCAPSRKRGILRGDTWDIAKWRNMTQRERAALDGVMTGDMRDGPVTVSLKSAPKPAGGER